MATVYGDSKIAGKAVDYGLSSAQNWLTENQGYGGEYPGMTAYTAPVDQAYGVNYTANATPYQTVDGLTTDWSQFQEQMRQPVYQTYSQNLRDIDSRFSNNGLYGSRGYGMNDDTLVKAGEGMMTGLLNADIAAQDQYLKDAQFQADQNLNAWKTGLTDAERQQTYDQNQFLWNAQNDQSQVDFANSEAARQDAYNQNKFDWDYGQYRQPFIDYLTLAGSATSTANAGAANQAAIDAANINADAAGSSAWMTALGKAGGGLLGSDWFGDKASGWLDKLFT